MKNRKLTVEETMALLTSERNASVAAANLDAAKAGLYVAQLNLKRCEESAQQTQILFAETQEKLKLTPPYRVSSEGEVIVEETVEQGSTSSE